MKRKTKPVRLHLYGEFKKQIKNQVHSYREQIDGFQRRGGWAKWVKGIKKYKLSVIK